MCKPVYCNLVTMKQTLAIILIAGLFFSAGCEKSISFTPNAAEPVLVVEATIENNQPPFVILSRSLNYFSTITPEILAGSFEHNAEVTISNGTKTHKLKEYFFVTDSSNKIYYYSIDSASLGTAFIGALNQSYTLKVKTAAGKEYSAVTTIPNLTKQLDTLWWVKAPENPDTTKVVLMTRVTDPPGFGNYIRYYTRVGNNNFYPGLNSVFDDQIIDGTTYEIEVEKGVDRNADIDFETYSFFTRGDTVTVKFTNIDKATYDFWRTMEYLYSSIGNPFSSPNRVESNIQGGGLGYFGGYAVQYKSLIIPK